MRNRLLLLSVLLFMGMGCRNTVAKQRTTAPIAKEVIPPLFEQDSAYQFIASQLAFGYRIPGTPEHARAAVWLQEKMRQYGATVTLQEGSRKGYDGTQFPIKNIIASFQPEKSERVLLFAHWDSRPYADNDPDPANHKKPVPAANDGGSGVGVLLEVARQLSLKPTAVGIDIILFDTEDWGTPTFYTGADQPNTWALGSQFWAETPHIHGYKARFGLLLDMVGGKNATFAKEGYSLKYAEHIVEKVWTAAQKIGYGGYFDQNRGGYIDDDHLPVNKMGIPSIDIIEYNATSSSGFNPTWHTVHDTLDNIDKRTLKAVGQTILQVIYNEPN